MHYFKGMLSWGLGTREERMERLRREIDGADAIVIGAGAGLSTSAGFVYSGQRFDTYFSDFAAAYGFDNMYAGGFYPFPDEETFWGYWARYIYINRYMDAPKPVYDTLLDLVRERDYFVITTNVDHQFQKAGFDKQRLFYTQGDYGLLQSVNPKIRRTYDNEAWIMAMMEAEGFVRNADGIFTFPASGRVSMRIPTDLIPKCPEDGSAMTTNLRADDTFVEDEGWQAAAERYDAYLDRHAEDHVLYLELGVGSNTPVIIKYPFWRMTDANPRAVYACINYGEACCPRQIEERSIILDGDIGDILNKI